MAKSLIVVVRLSASFGDVWRQLVEGLDAEVHVMAPGDVRDVPRTTAVLLAAGGAEREAMEWLNGRERRAGGPVLVVGADPGRRIAAQMVAHGARDYFALPEDAELLRNALAAHVQRRHDVAGRSPPSEPDVNPFQRIVGDSPALKAVLGRAARMSPHSHGNALIIGESGTGKELLARAIHDAGPRQGAPFVPVNCSALPPALIESELFGHEKGASTDAHVTKPGVFEVAAGGTLFLDEIGSLPVDLQAKLLRVLDDREVRRVGATKPHRLDVRVIAASDEDLDDAIRRGTFRRDLYFRLSVITLELPPLRVRGNDVLVIAERLLTSLAAVHGLTVPILGTEAQRVLKEYPWPGNIRELKNALERALLLSPPGTLALAELMPAVSDVAWAVGLPFPGELDAITAAAARATLESCGGNVSEAARRLKVSRARLRRLVHATETGSAPSGAGTN